MVKFLFAGASDGTGRAAVAPSDADRNGGWVPDRAGRCRGRPVRDDDIFFDIIPARAPQARRAGTHPPLIRWEMPSYCTVPKHAALAYFGFPGSMPPAIAVIAQ